MNLYLKGHKERMREMKLPVTIWVRGSGCRVAGMRAQVSLKTDFTFVKKLMWMCR